MFVLLDKRSSHIFLTIVFIKKIQEVIRDFPSALGLAIVVSATTADPVYNLPDIQGNEKGRKLMVDALQKLCFAVLCLPINITGSSLKHAMNALASEDIQYPKTYRKLILYFTGHGSPGAIYTLDGKVKIQYIYDVLKQISNRSEEPIPMVFIFDSCGVGTSLSTHNTLLISASLPASTDFASTGQCGVLSQHLAKALTDPVHSHSSLVDIAAHVKKEISLLMKHNRRGFRVFHNEPVVIIGSHIQPFYFQQDRMTASKCFLF